MLQRVFRIKVPNHEKAPKKTPVTVAGTTVWCPSWECVSFFVVIAMVAHSGQGCKGASQFIC